MDALPLDAPRLAEGPLTDLPPGDGAVGPRPPAGPHPAPPRPALPVARPATRRFRLARAYAAALRVALSYLGFEAVAAVRGPAWRARRRDALHRRNGRRVRRAILRLRGLFVKVGQLASVLTNFLPEPFRAELEGLQDQVPAGPAAESRARIEAELGAPPEALFATFENAPVASASLAQVHRATLADGRAVAVKVQHADIEAIARLDLQAIRTILRAVGRWFGVGGLREQLAEIETVVLGELDFRREATATESFGATLGGRPGLGVPAVVPERSALRVLTTEWVDGIKAGDLAALDAAGIDRAALAAQIVDAYGHMIFRDGHYHADPHPGNLVVTPDGTLTFLDFGATADLTPGMQRGLAEFLMGVLGRDAGRVTDSLTTMGFVPQGDGLGAVRDLVERIHERVLRDLDPDAFRLADLNAGMAFAGKKDAFADMADLGVSFRDLAGAFQVPRDWILLERTALLVLGLCTALDPTLNPFRLLWPYVEPLVDESELRRTLVDRATGVVRQAVALPGLVTRVLERVDRGEAEVRVPALERAADRVVGAARQVVYTLVATGTGGVGYAAHLHGDIGLSLGLGLLSSLAGLALLASLWTSRR